METLRTEKVVDADGSTRSAASWPAIVAGGIAAAALTLVLLAFGSAVGFSSVSPWANVGLSAGTFKIATGVYLVVVAMLSSTVGGYMAGRLRTKWVGIHSEEVKFRDTAHGFLAWCLATVLGVGFLAAGATYLVGGAGQGSSQANARSSAVDYYTAMLLRPNQGSQPAGAQAGTSDAARRDAAIILQRSVTRSGDLPAADRSYLAQLVSVHAGLPPADADRRVAEVANQAKAAADEARKSAAALSLWLAISMLVGAFSASLAALEGGQLRDGRWKGVIGARAYRSIETR